MGETLYFKEEDNQELYLFDENGKEVDWYCPVLEFTREKDGLIMVDNGHAEYMIGSDEYTSYKIGDCSCGQPW